MSVIGIAEGPEQIADGTDPSQLAEVDADGNLSVLSKGVDENGTARAIAVDPSGRLTLSVSEILMAILVELKTLNMLHASTLSDSDPQSIREEMTNQLMQ